MKKDYYRTLGVPKNASDSAIKSAYRKLAKKYHPDTNRGNESAKRMFQEVGEAYRILSDTESRRIYDKCGSDAFENGMDPKEYEKAYDAAQHSGYSRTFYTGPGDSRNEQQFDSFDDLFQNFFGHSSGYHRSYTHQYYDFNPFDRQPEPEPERTSAPHKTVFVKNGVSFEQDGLDLYSTQTIPVLTAILGGETPLKTTTGTVLVKIPAGTQPGKKIRLKGKGMHSFGSTGDLYISVQVHIPEDLTPYEKKKLRDFEKLYQKHHGTEQEAG